ncbi:MAG: LarC family nickel insertion protein [Alphaproteobacteria bacterium]|nr:LarC family nickel insertion protein [Alphaproteobacteria bacterium]
MHIHLDPVGGVAGDMFVAALLDAFPEHERAVVEAVRAVTQGEAVARLVAFKDHALAGHRFEINVAKAPHDHATLSDIEAKLSTASLPPPVRARARAIFALLAAAESHVHGIPAERVIFHEVGALDSIADIVAAATSIEAIGEARYSIGPLPLGSGRVDSAHGTLPVPAPAVVELLQGFVVHDDGIAGERVTPTGAAILRHLAPTPSAIPTAILTRRGLGFGTRRLPGLSNVFRVLALEPVGGERAWQRDQVALLSFEVDDQSPEDLALGLDHLRALDGVLDVIQIPAATKKGRLALQVQVLTRPEARDAAIMACFEETTTIGLRHALIERAILPRSMEPHEGARVKLATRPSGRRSAKPEADDLALVSGGCKAREAARRRAIVSALDGDDDHE